MSFSQHVAKHKNAILYYQVLFSLVLTILLLFFFKRFIPEFKVRWLFGFFITMSVVTQLACTFIPETGGIITKYHRTLAGISAVLLIPTLICLLFTTNLTLISKIIISLSLLIMIFIIYEVLKNKGTHKHFLVLQSIYFLVFFISIFVISF